MQDNLRKWFKAMKEGVSSLVIYKYYDPDFKLAITQELEITANVPKMKQFFAGIKPKTKDGNMWFQIYVGFDEDKEDIKGNTDWWYKQQNSALYRKHLQVQRLVRH